MPPFVTYLTCPDCLIPSAVADDAVRFLCFSCYAQIVFERCTSCDFTQSIPSRWQRAFTCGRCGSKVDIPRQRFYSSSAKARTVQGHGHIYPKL
jgi:predicted RNA-binding Zn-ribbon protein involved in translation (DUF1610 family)